MSDLKETLEGLHDSVASELADIIENGQTVAVGDGVAKVTAPASYFAAAIALLKHNNIQAVATKKNGLGKLEAALKSVSVPGADLQSRLSDAE